MSGQMPLIGAFEAANGYRYGFNFRRQLERAESVIAAQLAALHPRYAGLDLKIRRLTAEDLAEWEGWESNYHDRSFHWKQLSDQDHKANQVFGRRTCVAIRAGGQLCGLAHFDISHDRTHFTITQLEAAPYAHPLKGAVTFCVYQAGLMLAKNFGCTTLWTCGPIYSPVLEHQCRVLGFTQFDDGQYVHYRRPIGPETTFEPDMFKRPLPKKYAPAP